MRIRHFPLCFAIREMGFHGFATSAVASCYGVEQPFMRMKARFR